MKKLIALLLASIMVLGILAACDGAETDTPTTTTTIESITDTEPPATNLTGNLVVWSFTNELMIHAIAFQENNPEINLDYVFFPTAQFSSNVIAAADTAECPDVVGLEAAFVKTFVESELLMDISDLLPTANFVGAYPNTIEVGTDAATGEVRAFSYQTTPGAVFYRRSIAQEFFGTDDPAEIQAMMETMDDFLDMGRTLRDESDGTVFLLASVNELTNAFYANRTSPWVVDNQLVIDPMIDEMFDVARTIRSEGLDAQAGQWGEGWSSSMNDGLVDPVTGEQLRVFTYFLPTWGLPYVIAPRATDTGGDWAVARGPLPYFWGGTWVGVMNNASNPENGKEFVKFVTMNEEHLENWATGVYTADYLAEINPELALDPELLQRDDDGNLVDSLGGQPAGDFVNSTNVVERLIPQFEDAAMSEFLGGQNFYAFWNEAAPFVSSERVQGTDEVIQAIVGDLLDRYATGEEYTDYDDVVSEIRARVASDLNIS